MFFDRKAAKRHQKLFSRKRMREYRCDQHPGMWHLGHLPQAAVCGIKTVAEVYRDVA